MFKHNFSIFLRNFKRYKSASLINLFGLSVGLASALLIYLWVNDELSINRFSEEDSDRHFQVFVNSPHPSGIHSNNNAPTPMSAAMEAEFPEVEKGIPIVASTYYQGILSVEEQYLRAVPLFVGDGYFSVFGCDFLVGDKAGAFSDKNQIVISDQLAIGLLGSAENAIGKTINFNSEYFAGPYVVTGVFKPAAGAAMPFDVLLSFEQFLTGRPEMMEWYNGGTQTHLILKEGVDLEQFNAKIKDFLKTKFKNTKQELFAQPYADTYLFGKYENGFPVASRMVNVRIFSLIAIFILAIACINYMNLSTAQATRRIKEIGVKKAIGAHRRTLVYQYFGESMFMTFLALIISTGIAMLLLPQFNQITGKPLEITQISGIALPVFFITFLTGFVSGIYPGLYLSGFNPVLALKGKTSTGSDALWLRKGLVVFQFTISVVLMMVVIVIYTQINFIQKFNLGYDAEQLVSFRQEGKLVEDPEAFLAEVRKIPSVTHASFMWGNLAGQISGRYNLKWENQDPDLKSTEFHFIEGGHDMGELLGVELLAGRFLSRDFPTDNKALVVNETTAKLMGHENPVGEKLWVGDAYTIVGMVKDFHFEGVHEEIKPFFFILEPDGDNFIANIQGQNQMEAIAQIEELHTAFNPGFPFEFKFVDENYQKLYDEERRIATLSKYFAGIAISISCLGLLALTAFSTQRRFKEIAIRKVLGSSSLGIVRLLSREFIVLVLLAIIIALPIGHTLMKNWLDGFANRIQLEPLYFVLAGLAMLLVAGLTIMAQTTRSAQINVVESLRTEG